MQKLFMQNDFKEVVEMLSLAKHIYIIGDGGSAALADHFACDLLKNCGLPAISLCSNTAMITAIGNDYVFDEVFSRQLKILFLPHDLLVIFSTSGNSINLVKASLAVDRVLVISGNGGGKLKEHATILFDVGSDDQQESENRMLVFCHEIMKLLRN